MEQFRKAMLPKGSMEGETILVTGGGTGLGKAMSKHFLELGAQVIISSRKLPVLQETAKELEAETGGKVLAVACDIRHYDQVENVLTQGVAHFGKITGLVNNAAGNFISPTERLSSNAFDTIIDIVLKGSYNCTLALGKYWIKNEIPGNILNIITTYAFTGSGFVVPSACAKGGVLAMTRSLGAEWGPKNIRINAVAPGPFPTKGAWDRLFPKELLEALSAENRVPLGRVGDHQELANLAAYLMSGFAAYITGEVITIDGGEWLKGAGQFNWASEISSDKWDQIEQLIRSKSKGK